MVPHKALALTGHLEQGQKSSFSEEAVMTFKDLLAESYEIGAILQHGMAYELIDFLARLQVTTVTRMSQDHAKQQMVQRALTNELQSDKELQLQKIGRKGITKTRHARIEL